MSKHLGPYMNDDGDWWVPIEDVKSFKEARGRVEGCLSYDIPYDGTLVYKGKEKALICDIHVGEEIGPCCGIQEDGTNCSRYVLSYHWVENRKW